MTDRLVEAMAAYSDSDAEAIWSDFARSFALKAPADRIAELKNVDVWMEAQGPTLTREHASLLQRKRQLEDVHFSLRRAGR